MAKQYMMPLLRRLTNLRTEVATGRTRNHYGVGRELTGEELSEEDGNRKAGTVDVRRTLARHCACSALLAFLHGLETPPAIATIKNFGVHAKHNQAHHAKIMLRHAKSRAKKAILRPYVQVWPGRVRGPPKKNCPVKKEWQVGRDNNSRSRPRTARPGSHGGGWCRRAEPAALRALLRADGQLTTATPTWACGLPARAQRLHSAAQRAEAESTG